MATGFATTILRNALGDAIINAVGGGAKLQIYSGARPANGAAITTQTLLAEHTMATPFAPATSNAVVTATLPANVNASLTGTATWFRVVKSDGTTFLMDGSAGVTGSGADMILNSSSYIAGVPSVILQFNMTVGNAGL